MSLGSSDIIFFQFINSSVFDFWWELNLINIAKVCVCVREREREASKNEKKKLLQLIETIKEAETTNNLADKPFWLYNKTGMFLVSSCYKIRSTLELSRMKT